MHKFLLDKNSIKTLLEQNNGHSFRWLRSTSFLGGFSWCTFCPVAKKVPWPPALISTNLDDDVSTLMTMFRPWWWCLDPPWFEERERRKWAPRAPMAWRGLCSEAWRDPRCHCCHCNHVHYHWHDIMMVTFAADYELSWPDWEHQARRSKCCPASKIVQPGEVGFWFRCQVSLLCFYIWQHIFQPDEI